MTSPPPTPLPNRATLWAHVFVDELARAGLQVACLAPGSRSTPLTIAFAQHGGIRVFSHLDERSAAFFALGHALATGKPVALVCTSGTAAANFYPAIIEANYAHVPLLILTADRPHELRDTGANQTIDQLKMYGDHVRWFADVAPPESDPPPKVVRSLRTLADRAFAAAAGNPPGPVHLNFPFRKPLEPTPTADIIPEDLWARPAETPFTRLSQAPRQPTPAQLEAAQAALHPEGMIVCGPRCPGGGFPAAVADLARATGYPLVVDVLSGVRFGPHTAGLRVLSPLAAGEMPVPSTVLHFGATPTSKPLISFLENLPVTTRRIAVQAHGAWHDDAHTLSDLLAADPEAFCRLLADRLPPAPLAPPDWAASYQQADERYWAAVRTRFSQSWPEGAVLADVVEVMPPGGRLYVANSNPVRHLDAFAAPSTKPLQVFGNRGASGIDGTISSALGAAAAEGGPLVLVTGDLSFYHDMNGLLALRRCNLLRATIVLIHNDGGGIFRRLPIAQFDPPFTELFLTPHGLDFEPVVRMFGAGFTRADGQATFRAALAEAIGAETPQVIEVNY